MLALDKRYARESLDWFITACAQAGVRALITRSIWTSNVTIQLTGLGWCVPQLGIEKVTLWNQGSHGSYLFTEACDITFVIQYKAIREIAQKCYDWVTNIDIHYRTDVTRMWLRCALRLGVCKDIRLVIGRIVWKNAVVR